MARVKKERRPLRGVRYIRRSGNRKLGRHSVDAIYIAIAPSCLDCPFKPDEDGKKGCWGTVGRVGIVNMRLEEEAVGMDRRTLGREVARAIEEAYVRRVPEGRYLRLPVIGDVSTPSAVDPVRKAIARWLAKGGAGVWGYTHGWRRVPRASWGSASMLASVETIAEVSQAREQGYAAARVVASFPNGPRAWMEEGVRHIPCPEQTLGVRCEDCQLCFNDKALLERDSIIAFRVHSQIKKRALTVLQEKSPCRSSTASSSRSP